MDQCKTCDGTMPRDSGKEFCGVCMAVLPDIVQIPTGISMTSIDNAVIKFREDLGNPGTDLREIWRAVRELPDRDDIEWLFEGTTPKEGEEWRWITSPPPAIRFDQDVVDFLSERLHLFRNDRPSIRIMRNLQRGGTLPSGQFLSWTGGRWFLDGKEIEVPHILLSKMLEQRGGGNDINWGRLLLTIDLAVTQIAHRGSMLGNPRNGTTLNPALYLVAERSGRARNFTSYKGPGLRKLTSHPSDFGDAGWLKSWTDNDSEGWVMPGLPKAEHAIQRTSLKIHKGRLCMSVRRPNGNFRLINVPPHPDLVARITSWFLSNPETREFSRMECLRTRIFAGANSSLVEGPERVALKLLRSVVDSTRGCSLIPEEGYFRVRGTSGLVYEIQSCSRGAGAHGSRFKMRCIGPDGEEKRFVSPWEEGPHRDDICIRESVGSRLPLGDVLVQAILTASQDKESASSGIQSIRNNIANWQNRLEQSRIRRRRREDPIGAAFRNVERIADMLRHDWIHRRVRRASASFPSLWSAMIRAPTGSVLRFTSLVNAENSIGGPNVIFDGVTTRFRTENRHERQIVRSMLLGSGWTRQTQEERRLGVSQIWHRTSRPDDNELQEAVIRFCELIEGLVQVNGRRAPLAPENLEQIFEADSEVYNTALLPGSRGLIR